MHERKIRWELSGGAALLFALAYFLDNDGLIAAMLPAILIHELGHVFALKRFHTRIRRVRIGVFGIELNYSGALAPSELVIVALAGPAAGLIYTFTAFQAGGSYFSFSASISAFLSLFNLLPILPLDGGRIVESLAGRECAEVISLAGAAFLFVNGLVLLVLYRVLAPAAVGLWLLCCRIRRKRKLFSY